MKKSIIDRIKFICFLLIVFVIGNIIATLSNNQITSGKAITRVFLLFFGCCWIYNGISDLIKYFRNQHREYYIVSGKIVSFKEEITRGRNGDFTTFYPVFEYYYNGKIYQNVHTAGMAKVEKGFILPDDSKYKIGQEVDIRVYANDPTESILDGTVKNLLWLGIFWIILGSIMVIAISMIFLKLFF